MSDTRVSVTLNIYDTVLYRRGGALRSCPNLLRCCQNLDFGYSTHALADLVYNSHAPALQEQIYLRLAKRHCCSSRMSVKMTHKREADEARVVGYGACRRTEYYPNNTVRKQSRSMLDPDRGACQCTESILPTLYKRATNRYTLITPVYPNRIPTAADRTMIKIGLSFLYRSRNNATAKMPRLT